MKTKHTRWVTLTAAVVLAAVTLPARAEKPVDPFKSNFDNYPITTAPHPQAQQQQQQQPAPGQYPWVQQSNEYVTDWPATEARAVPAARANAVRAKWEYWRAKDNLYSTVDMLKDDFEESGQAKSAKQARDTAHDQLDTVRNRALGRLSIEPRYQALRKLRDQADQHVQQLRDQHATAQQLAAAAQVKMQFSRQMSEMEHDALLADPEYGETKARLIVAGQDVTRIRTAFQRQLVRSDDFRDARRDWEDARIDYVTAVTYSVNVVDVANIAVQYAYDLHYYDLYRYLHMGSYAPYYYSSSYGGAYGVSYPSVYSGYNYYRPSVSHHGSMFRY
jgi:hypothetical protein